ncbi:uncharacterized protein [Montipora capricornis]|uniref:uncharacterized protein n=1 Tax=Montipora capricornis TaxID=246305 RepID=UPI0035F136C2
MAFNLRYRVVIHNLLVHSLLLWYCNGPVNSNPLPNSITCNPRDGKIGTSESIIVRVERFDDTSVNFRRDKPRLLSTVHRTISNDGKVYYLDFNLKAKFHGSEVCLSTLKETIVNEKGADERRLYTCEHVCLQVGNDGSLVTNSSSGGRVWPGKRCCVWSRNRYFKLTPLNEGPKCLSCLGRECLKKNIKTKQCGPGDKCVAITLKEKQNRTGKNSSIVPIMLGCSSDDSLRGYTCSDGCRREVQLVGTGTSNVCVQCCAEDDCNRIKKQPSKNSTQTATIEADNTNDSVQENGAIRINRNANLTVISVIFALWFFKTGVAL